MVNRHIRLYVMFLMFLNICFSHFQVLSKLIAIIYIAI